MCDLDLDRAQVWCERIRERRKRRTALKHPIALRRCDCCFTYIEYGQVYLEVYSVTDGSADTSRACLLCAFALEEFGEAHRMRVHPEMFLDLLTDCYRGDDAENVRWWELASELRGRKALARGVAA